MQAKTWSALIEHSAILSTCTKLSPVFSTFVLSIFEWRLTAGFTVQAKNLDLSYNQCFCPFTDR